MTDPDLFRSTRLELQRVATHLLARARFAADGRFGLRVTPTGIGTPLFGSNGTVLRIAATTLIHEFRVAGEARSATTTLAGRSLRELAEFAGIDLKSPFSAGSDSPELGDADAPVEVDAAAGSEVLAWLKVGAEAVDRVLPLTHEPSVAQLWPEHFDIGVDVASGHGRVNLGASPGDSFSPEPYLYVSPWEESRPGDPRFWNAPFGAVLDRGAVLDAPDAVGHAAAFFREGLRLLG